MGSAYHVLQTIFSGPVQRSAKRRGCLLSYSQAEPGRELTQPSPCLLAEPCTNACINDGTVWVLDAGSHMVAFTIVVGVALVGVVHLHLHLVGNGDGKGLLGDGTTAVSETGVAAGIFPTFCLLFGLDVAAPSELVGKMVAAVGGLAPCVIGLGLIVLLWVFGGFPSFGCWSCTWRCSGQIVWRNGFLNL